MSRRHAAEKRIIFPDVKYKSTLVAKFINKIMNQGKKAKAEKIFYKALGIIENKYKVDGFTTFNDTMNKLKPYLEVTSVRVGGANYQVPSPVDERRGYALAMRWIIDAALKRSEKDMISKIAEEIFDGSNGRGGAFKKREDTHKMAEANKAFAHFSPKRNQAGQGR